MTVDAVTGRPLMSYAGTSDDRLGFDELLDMVARDIAAHPRTLQTALGPSDVGDPCPRKIAYKLLGWPERECEPAWLPWIGTACHEAMACVLHAENARTRALVGADRYLIEYPVSITTPAGRVIGGHLDMYDAALAEVDDHKFVGTTTLKAAKAGRVGGGYKAQLGIYGAAMQRAGFRVDRIRVMFWPRNELSMRKAHQWVDTVTPYELDAGATRVLTRFDNIADGVEQLGPAALLQLEAVDSNCAHCPFFTPGSTSPLGGCPGPEAMQVRASTSGPAASRQLAGLIPA